MKKTKVYLKDIMSRYQGEDYSRIYADIMRRIDKGELKPVKSAGTNGLKPALPLAFWSYPEEQNYAEVFEELKFKLHPSIDTSYYRAHPDRYESDKKAIRLLSDYLTNGSLLLNIKETINERSFEIFRKEKFLQEKGGLTFCARLGIGEEQLNIYQTSEPLSYYSHSKKASQNIMIIENKDTFYDIRRHMQGVGCVIFGIEFGTVIYGAGKGIWKTFSDYATGAESYFNSVNRLLYFGDIDYEGILIYEYLVRQAWTDTAGTGIRIAPFVEAYEAMLDKAEQIGIEGLPFMKEKQNRNIDSIFLDFFDADRKKQLLHILAADRYIPQEILNEHDWR